MENKHSEKLEDLLREKAEEHASELRRLGDENSEDVENKISAVMAELYEQKRESLRRQDEEHRVKIGAVEEESRKTMLEKESEWGDVKQGLEEEITR